MKKTVACTAVVLACLLFCSCTLQLPLHEDGASPTPAATPTAVPTAEPALPLSETDRITDYTQDAVLITCSKESVTLTKAGTYVLSGTLEDGQIVVDAGDSAVLHLVLEGLSVTSKSAAALCIRQADRVVVTLAEGTENTLKNGGSFAADAEENADGAIFAKSDLTFNGEGSLTVESSAGHGVVCKDGLVLVSGSITVRSAGHAIECKNGVRLEQAELYLDAGKDGIHAEHEEDESLGFVCLTGGSCTVRAEGDGVSAGSYVRIDGGTWDIETGGGSKNAAQSVSPGWGGFMGGPQNSSDSSEDDGESIKGIKAAQAVYIYGGDLRMDCADDGVHSNGIVSISGGELHIATGDDGVHADESLEITGGTVEVTESYEGLEALSITISGGTITLKATDDGINAAGGTDGSGMGGMRPGGDRFGGGPGARASASTGSITISGGSIYAQASGDGIDSNGSLRISGGQITVCCPSSGDTSALDYDTEAVISGGIFIGTGAQGMAQSFSSSEGQGVIAASVGNCGAGTPIELRDGQGSTLLSASPALPYSVVILSSPEIKKGENYTLCVGDLSGVLQAD